jgi:hypothetical protein
MKEIHIRSWNKMLSEDIIQVCCPHGRLELIPSESVG